LPFSGYIRLIAWKLRLSYSISIRSWYFLINFNIVNYIKENKDFYLPFIGEDDSDFDEYIE